MRNTDLKRMRDEALYKTYVQGLENGNFANQEAAADYSRLHSAPQFFIEAKRASVYIGMLESGNNLNELNCASRRRVMEIYRRYKAWREAHPDVKLPRERVLEEIVMEEAPEFYLMRQQARKIIQRMRRSRMHALINNAGK